MSVHADYLAWHRLQVDTDDIDPVYPLLDVYADDRGLDDDGRAWLCMVHTAWYHLGSTFTVFEDYPTPADLPSSYAGLDVAGLLALPTGTERRAHRSPRQLANHLTGMRRMWSEVSVWDWCAKDWAWTALNDRLTTIRGNGRWAAYKAAEMLQKVAHAPTQATDAGHAHSSGPRQGLSLLYSNLPDGQTGAAISTLDAVTSHLQAQLGEADVARVETSLCDFHSLSNGGYYLGHDVDQMLAQLLHPKADVPDVVWDYREAIFDRAFLGERNGWEGPRRDLKRAYQRDGTLDWRAA